MNFSKIFYVVLYLFVGMYAALAMEQNSNEQWIHRVINSSVGYSQKEEDKFKIQKNGEDYFIAPETSIKPIHQSVRFYNESPKIEPSEERVLQKIIPNKDGRERIIKTTQWPYLLHGQLTMHYLDEQNDPAASGVLIGPHHFLTAAHNVYNYTKRKWAQSITVRLGLNDNVAPFGEIKVAQFYIINNYVESQDQNSDMALLILEHSIGTNTGWCGLLCSNDENLLKEKVTITGYPGDHGNGKWMMSMSHFLKKVTPGQFNYEIDTAGGQSGSSILIYKNNLQLPYVAGIHTMGSKLSNSGVRLSLNKLRTLHQLITKTWTLELNPKNVSENYFQNGVSKYKKKNFKEALQLFKLAAEKNHVHAQYYIGYMFSNARGVSRNYPEAVNWYRKAAHQGHPRALYALGRKYYHGHGVIKNRKEAIELYSKSAEGGYDKAKRALKKMKKKKKKKK